MGNNPTCLDTFWTYGHIDPHERTEGSRQIGVFTGSVLIFIVACLTIRFIRPPDTLSLIFVGLLWMVLMGAFKLCLGLLMGRSWASLLSDYTLRKPSEGLESLLGV